MAPKPSSCAQNCECSRHSYSGPMLAQTIECEFLCWIKANNLCRKCHNCTYLRFSKIMLEKYRRLQEFSFWLLKICFRIWFSSNFRSHIRIINAKFFYWNATMKWGKQFQENIHTSIQYTNHKKIPSLETIICISDWVSIFWNLIYSG